MDLATGTRRAMEIGPRWTAQVDGIFIKWKKMIDGDEILALREAVIELQGKFGVDANIDVRAFIESKNCYKDIPVQLYIEHYGCNLENLRQEILEIREKEIEKVKKELKKNNDFPFLMFGKDE